MKTTQVTKGHLLQLRMKLHNLKEAMSYNRNQLLSAYMHIMQTCSSIPTSLCLSFRTCCRFLSTVGRTTVLVRSLRKVQKSGQCANSTRNTVNCQKMAASVLLVGEE